ncbi:MAG: Grx4 family monothiol glutaredoxin [OCS116 cluster bacterium]|uniref:Glutaredoxin n=1 Tax=OCS116 cluster bacterium TaxID=2030921 RepID=A0A2A4Z106_9PROT|nr:Grx4 family monothiol glutaredoxin [OCS116 cluster bacterium]
MSEAQNFIENAVKTNDVVLFMKGTKDFPQCGFSGLATQILNYLNIDYTDVNVLENEEVREGIKAYSDWPTIPQVYIKGEFIGGADILRDMFETGEIRSVLDAKGIAYSVAEQ